MLLEAAGDRAGLRRHLSVEEVVAAFQRALEEAASIVADAAGKIVGRNVRGGASRCAQTHGEAAGQIEQDLRHKVAGVAQRLQSVFLCLPDERIVGLFQQLFKCDQVLQVFHILAPFSVFAVLRR